jgi:large subunit ribosomal protein L33
VASSSSRRKDIVYLIPEGETRDSHTYHYTLQKTKSLKGQKVKFKKYNPVKRKHEMFVEVKAPGHN